MAEEMKNRTVLTKEGLKKLEEQLDYYVAVRRNEIAEQIAVARGFGDLSENAEYDEAKKEQAKLEEEILRLDNMIRTAVVINDEEITTEQVNVGTLVKVKDLDTGDMEEYAIVGAQEADPYENKISNESPVGAALLGHKAGDKVEIEVPMGILNYEVLSITRQ
ncbi:MAG: transcription elongation factor GreA [Clostridia bacterium]|nr:transcription elongation factor GreA [Clostridia bacterium]